MRMSKDTGRWLALMLLTLLLVIFTAMTIKSAYRDADAPTPGEKRLEAVDGVLSLGIF